MQESNPRKFFPRKRCAHVQKLQRWLDISIYFAMIKMSDELIYSNAPFDLVGIACLLPLFVAWYLLVSNNIMKCSGFFILVLTLLLQSFSGSVASPSLTATFSSTKVSPIASTITMKCAELPVRGVESPFPAVASLQCFENFILSTLCVRSV